MTAPAPAARISLGVPAAFAALGAAIPVAWQGALEPIPAAALGAAAAAGIGAAAMARRRLEARLGGASAASALRAFPGRLTLALTLPLVAAAAFLAALHGERSIPAIGAAFAAIAFALPLQRWASGAARIAAARRDLDLGPAGRPRPLGLAVFECLALGAALVALPLAHRLGLAAGRAEGDPVSAAVGLAAALALAAVAGAVAGRASRGFSTRAAGLDALPDSAPPGVPPAAVAEVAAFDAEVAAMPVRYEEARDTQGALIEKRRRLREQKAQVFASMSHDLRGPLNSIVGFSDLLLKGMDGQLTRDQRATVVEIAREAERLLVLIGDILDTAKMEAGRFEVEPAWAPSAEILAACEEGSHRFLAAKGIRLTIERGASLPPLRLDKERIVGVLLGLVARAADAMQKGTLLLRARQVTSLEEARDYLRFELVDAGGDVDPEFLERVLDVHASLEGVAVSAENGGLALGLALALRIVRMHGGEVDVAAEPGGVLFAVELPLDRDEDGD